MRVAQCRRGSKNRGDGPLVTVTLYGSPMVTTSCHRFPTQRVGVDGVVRLEEVGEDIDRLRFPRVIRLGSSRICLVVTHDAVEVDPSVTSTNRISSDGSESCRSLTHVSPRSGSTTW